MPHRPASAWTAYACLALSMSLVGSYVALSKPLVAALPVFLLAWLRFGIGGLAMLHWLKKPADEAPMTLADPPAAVPGVVPRQFPVFDLHAVRREPDQRGGRRRHHGGHSGGGGAAELAVSARAHQRRGCGLAVACAVLGIALVSLSKNELSAHMGSAQEADLASKNAWLGNLLLVGAVLCEAAYAVIGKKLTGVLGPKRITALINLWGFALVTPLGLWMAWDFDFAAVAPGSWLLLVFYALAASVWTVWLWMTGLKTMPANQAGVFTVMLPVSAAAVGVLVLGESLSGTQLGAFAHGADRRGAGDAAGTRQVQAGTGRAAAVNGGPPGAVGFRRTAPCTARAGRFSAPCPWCCAATR